MKDLKEKVHCVDHAQWPLNASKFNLKFQVEINRMATFHWQAPLF